MKDYISREAALDRIIGYDFQHCPDYMEDWATKLKHAVICDLKDAVEHLPAADVVPVVHAERKINAEKVVRCRECKWGRTVRECSEYVQCGKPYAPPWASHKEDWYCADGKRKEDTK